MKKLLKALFLSICVSTISAQNSIKESGQHQNFIYAGLSTYYELVSPTSPNESLKWHVTNGSFSQSSKVTTQNTFGPNQSVTVFWSNPAGDPPQGSVYAEILLESETLKSNVLTQKIISLNGTYPPSLVLLSASKVVNGYPAIKYGIQNIKVGLSDPFNLTYMGSTEPNHTVSKFEWNLPQNWSESETNKKNIFINKNSILNIVTDAIKEGTIKLKGIGMFDESDKSNSSSITIHRYLDWISPTNLDLKYGLQQEITYTVDAINGVTYEWQYPVGWTEKSKSGNSITLIKSPCATSADVKVRIHAESNVSEWFTKESSITPPEVTLPITSVRFKNILATIGIPSEKIASLSVSGNGINPTTVQNSNEITFYSTVTGNVTLNFTIKLKECGTSFSFTKDISIEELNLPISGENILCPDDSPYNYYIDNLPANINVTWNASANANNTIRLNNMTGATCNVTALKAGDATLRATFSRDGVSIFREKGIEVATDPKVPGASAYITYAYDRDFIRLEAHTSNIYGIRGYMWNVSGTSSDSGQASYIEVSSNGNYHYNVELRVYTQCGQFFASTIVGRSYATVYPNPVNQTLYINLEEQENVVSSTPSRIAKAPLAVKSYDIRLFNIQGTLVRNIKSNGGEISLDVSTLPNGNYFLHIYNNQETEPQIHKIVINH